MRFKGKMENIPLKEKTYKILRYDILTGKIPEGMPNVENRMDIDQISEMIDEKTHILDVGSGGGELMLALMKVKKITGICLDLNFDNMEMQAAMIDAMKFWVTETDIDGFRCDVAYMVPVEFWNDTRVALDSIKPMFMLAEAEQEDHHFEAFDMSYGWELMHIMNHIAKGDSSLKSLDDYMQREQKRFNENDYRMYFVTNHDENSWNGTIEERYGEAEKAFAVLAYTINGMPLIYSGQEYGNNNALEFFEKGPSAPTSNPLKLACARNSLSLLFPLRIFRSNTPEIAFPYSAGNAPE